MSALAARAVYAVFGALALAAGVAALIRPSVALPPDGVTPLTAHLVREQGAQGVFIGMMAIWYLFHLEERRPVHLALLVFAALFSAVHWLEYFEARRTLASPLVNSIPLLALALITPGPARRPEETK